MGKKTTLHSLAELQDYRDTMPLIHTEPVQEGTFTGALLKNPHYNKLFLWKFSRQNIEYIISIIAVFKEQPLNDSSIKALIYDLEIIAEQLFEENTNPIECILYASKTMSIQINNNRNLVNELSDLVYRLVLKEKEAGIEVLDHIISNWTWKTQQKVAIIAVGKLGNYELLAKIHRKFSNEPHVRYETFAALIDSANMDLLYAIEEIVSSLNGDDEIDRQIGNYFINTFRTNFGTEGAKEMEFFLKNSKQISLHSKKVLAKVCTVTHSDVLTRQMIIQLAQQSRPKYPNSEKEKEVCFSQLLDALNGTGTADALFALRFVHTPAAIKAIANKLIELRTVPHQNKAVQWGIISLGFLNAYEEIDLIKSFINDLNFRNYVWGALILLGNNVYVPDLVSAFFYSDNYSTAQDAINQVIKSSYPLQTAIINTFVSVLNNQGESDQRRTIISFKELLNRPNTKVLIVSNLVTQLCDLMGLNGSPIVIKGEGNQILILTLLKECMAVKNNTEVFQKLLFLIIEEKVYAMPIKASANKILQDPKVFPIKPPEA